MDRRIRFLALFLVGCFLLLFIQLNNLQVRQSSSLTELGCSKAYVHCAETDPFTEPRGEIVSADGVVLARSTPTNDGYGEQRSYPEGSLFADITGYYDVVDTAAPLGIEAEYDSYLQYHESNPTDLRQLLTTQSGTDTVVLTVSKQLQQDAANALASECIGEAGGCQEGAVVALDPQTGAILAMYGLPTYNPNELASHNSSEVHAAYSKLQDAADPSKSPLINFATGQTYPPGSTFKIITTSAIYDHDPSVAGIIWPFASSIHLPETDLTLSNFEGESCGGDLALSLARSCDTAYAQIGLKLGAATLHTEAQSFGLNSQVPIDLPSTEVAETCFPAVEGGGGTGANCPTGSQYEIGPQNKPGIAYSSIGQENVTETALQDALVAAAIGDGGKIMAPHLMQSIVSDTGNLVTGYHDHLWRQATNAQTAATVRELMRGVANTGTAAGVFQADDHVAAKTGTAQVGNAGCSANWMIATAPADPTDTPTIAVAAVVPFQPGLSCGDQGATVAGPVVAKVLQDALALQQSSKGSS